jgi:hypothetical protein
VIWFPDGSVVRGDDDAAHAALSAHVGRLVRLRPNLLLDIPGDGFVEDSWVGREAAIGSEVVLAVRMRTPRCVMVDLPQPGTTVDGRLLQTVSAVNDSCLGVVADVVRGGTVRAGEVAMLVG